MFYFKRNLPIWERVVRILLRIGTGIITAKLDLTLWIQIAGYATAATFAGTALIGFCPACALFGRKALEKSQ